MISYDIIKVNLKNKFQGSFPIFYKTMNKYCEKKA